MQYVDGYVLAVPSDNKDKYLDLAQKVAPIFKKHGATRVAETWGDNVPEGEVTSMPLAVKAKPEETVVFSWVEWPSKEVRDEAMTKIGAEMEETFDEFTNIFDGKRMIFGGFATLLDQ